MHIKAHIVSAFTDGDTGGNPAGVVLNADRLNQQQKQSFAAQLGVSETAFVSSSAIADFKLEFFTPERQIAHCGHATIATFSLLKNEGLVSGIATSKETIDGTRRIFIGDDTVFMEQTAPQYKGVSVEHRDASLKSLGISAEDIMAGVTPIVASTGNSFLLVPLRDEQSLASIQTDLPAIQRISEELDLVGFYVFSLQTKKAESIAAARMFAPKYGISEEAATGMAAGPLASFLYDHMGKKVRSMQIEQGHLMAVPSPSLITVNLGIKNDAIERVIVGGRAKIMKTICIPIHPALSRGAFKNNAAAEIQLAAH